jgi:hypothetical protein
MPDWLTGLSSRFTGAGVMVSATLVVVASFGSIALVVFLLVRLPPGYFHPAHDRRFMDGRHWALCWCGAIVKNVIGAILVVLGIVMSIPGVPGQGVLTMLVGVILLDFPGKRALERKIVSRPWLLRAINQLRARFSKPPLALE